MRQRAMIAMALANDPDILIADEPTTALDVTIQAQILDLIARLKDEFSSAVVLITHDLGVVADIADRIGVMYAGRLVEFGGKRDLFYDPQHPYTWGLLGSIPRLDRPKQDRLHSIAGMPPSLIDPPAGCRFRAALPACLRPVRDRARARGRAAAPRATSTAAGSTPRASARCASGDPRGVGRGVSALRRRRSSRSSDLVRTSRSAEGLLGRQVAAVHAVDGVTFSVRRGRDARARRRVGLRQVDARARVVRLLEPTSGDVRFRGTHIARLAARELRPLRREMQMVFQDPYASLNPRKRVGAIIADADADPPLGDAGASAAARSQRAARRRRPLARALQPLSRTSSPAGSASGSASPARSRSSRS